ncbi:hypothetical protein KSP35_10795 [Aquihabitans sp. G128]|uniref:hypothetical protein n=1 Tax=Aquihabitans sp. G128 TaxID=2849779 RepID=UPI001C22F010|nr:hypothetical protein [Aquihabitans sp. G128]QXC63224.1 hypothetical protein KSP35_10795 [Aquihabitans sp. G128]
MAEASEHGSTADGGVVPPAERAAPATERAAPDDGGTVVVRSPELTPLLHFAPTAACALLLGRSPSLWWAGCVASTALMGLWGWARRGRHRQEVVVDADGITSTNRKGSRRWDWADLDHVDGQEFAPNLTIHPREGRKVRLFPWFPDKDPAADQACELVLRRAAAAGVDVTQGPLALWRIEARDIDWDQAIVEPTWWARRRQKP